MGDESATAEPSRSRSAADASTLPADEGDGSAAASPYAGDDFEGDAAALSADASGATLSRSAAGDDVPAARPTVSRRAGDVSATGPVPAALSRSAAAPSASSAAGPALSRSTAAPSATSPAGGRSAAQPSAGRAALSRSASRATVSRTPAPRPTVSRSAADEDLAGDAGGPGLPFGDAAAPELPIDGGTPSLARQALEHASDGATALAPAARPMVSRVAQPEQPRPHLQLVRTDNTPAQPTISRAAERLAEATGGALEQGEGGLSTVHFPPPGSQGQPIDLSHQPYTISRELSEGGGAPAPSAPAEQHTPTEHPETGDKKEQMDPETMYEYFIDRFKRDLLIEREQLGHLIIDNP
ncbi:hypothetical protein [Solirubrobacter soli]|uniref:hypothetical protein n=1 Tax=Solirubrobacter soli TaxID=363832 RepID=UPI00040534E0|nr:hypothetical protein [Solirubrobacter soli]